jgi:hypothetical protein
MILTWVHRSMTVWVRSVPDGMLTLGAVLELTRPGV